jgi:hypothetical protein
MSLIGGPRISNSLDFAPKQTVENARELQIDTEGQATWAQQDPEVRALKRELRAFDEDLQR